MVYSTPYEALNKVWGYHNFRPLQSDIIQNVLDGMNTVAILPTGGGKSLCFQVPALCLEGICIVVTPIIALMKDQVEQLKKLGVRATAVYSGMSNKEIDITLDNCVLNQVKFLYVSPERLKSDLFIERAKRMNVSLLAIDEAHCISEWGYDFRPSYLEINIFRQYVAEARLIALTATATPLVVKDIIHQLDIEPEHKVFIQSFARANLSFIIRKAEDKVAQLHNILKKAEGSGIIYARTRKRTKEIVEFLLRKGISADYYHAGLSHNERNTKQQSWMTNRFRIMVATNAFGMGINKPDVRIVIHVDPPDNLESYYQEAGRAGRDGKKAYAVMIYHEKDKDDLINRVKMATPEPNYIRRVYQSLANYYKIAVGSSLFASYDFDLREFAGTYQLEYLEVFHALKKLEEQGFIQLTESFYHPSSVMIPISHEELYKFEVANSRYEPLIKGLLRQYGGELYANFITISEKRIASAIRTSTKDVEGKLDQLAGQDIIIYHKTRDKPQVTFTTPRYDAGKLPLDTAFLREKREADLDKARSINQYITQDQICRSVFIRHYFGEQSAGACGICDICVEKKAGKLTIKDLDLIRTTLLESLSGQPGTVNQLTERIGGHKKEILLQVLQELMDNEEVYYDERGWLFATDNP